MIGCLVFNELKRISKEVVVAYFKVLLHSLSVVTEEDHKETQSR